MQTCDLCKHYVATEQCEGCGNHLCEGCSQEWHGLHYCPDCYQTAREAIFEAQQAEAGRESALEVQ